VDVSGIDQFETDFWDTLRDPNGLLLDYKRSNAAGQALKPQDKTLRQEKVRV